jgi:hypothetical protein
MKRLALFIGLVAVFNLFTASPSLAQIIPIRTLAASDNVTTGVVNIPTWTVGITGTWTGTWSFDCDGTAKLGINESTGAAATTATVNGVYSFSNTGCQRFTATWARSTGSSTIIGIRGYATAIGGASTAASSVSVTNFPSTADSTAVAIQCVNAAATAFESCAGGTPPVVDADDGTVAAGQTGVGLSINENYRFNGTAWVRDTFGTAGVASAQVNTVQGIAGGTAVSVTFPSAQAITISGSLPPGTNNLGNVDVLSLPALVAGVADIGAVNLEIGGAPIAVNAGAASAVTPRIITASDSPDVTGIGAVADAAATAGSTGSLSAKLRLLTTQLDAAMASLDLIDNAVSGTGFNISQIGSAAPISSRCLNDALVTTVPITAAAAGNNQLVAISASTIIYVCGYDLVADGDVDAQWVYGTGTACATGETDISGIYPFDANNGRGVVRANAGSVQFKTIAGQALCLELSGAVTTGGYLTYVQQ